MPTTSQFTVNFIQNLAKYGKIEFMVQNLIPSKKSTKNFDFLKLLLTGFADKDICYRKTIGFKDGNALSFFIKS